MDKEQRLIIEEQMLDYWEQFNSLYEDSDPQEYSRIRGEIAKRRENRDGLDIEDLLPVNVMKSYREHYLQSRHWYLMREKKLRAVKGACEDCGRRATEIHHKHYRSLGGERTDDLVALCSSCHRLRHRK